MGLILPFSIFSSGSNIIIPSDVVTRVVLDSSDNAYISGNYFTLNGISRTYIAKILTPNDNIDRNFIYNSLSVVPQDIALNSTGTNLILTTGNSLIGLNTSTGTPTFPSYPTTNGVISTIFRDSSDNIFISGFFNVVAGNTRINFAKLSSTGTITIFDCNLDNIGYIVEMDNNPLNTDLFVAGSFDTIKTITKKGVAKVNINTGVVNNTFDCNLDFMADSIHICSDDNIFIGGSFTRIKTTTTIKGFGKVNNSTGALVAGFTQNAVPWSRVFKIKEYKSGIHQGKILVYGYIGSTPTLYRLNNNGTIDDFFGTSGYINVTGDILDIAIKSDSSTVVVGNFTTIGGKARSYYARIDSNGQVL